MLDPSIQEQLRAVFSSLEAASGPVDLVVRPSDHEKQAELLELCHEVAATSPRLSVRVEGSKSETVELSLHLSGAPTGIVFRAVPGGHEFTSLVLAILHAAGKGKLPDEGMQARVKRIKATAVRTYVSLDCTNCPDVVQALNVITVLNGGITHETVDGALHEAEVKSLGIQGVPAVFLGNAMIHSGRGTLVEVVEALEKHVGFAEAPTTETGAIKKYDVVVLGGGPAGASAAIYSARKGLKTALVTEKLGGQLKETLGIENMVGTKYTEGVRLAADLETHVRAYPVDILEHRRVTAVRQGEQKEIELHGGEKLSADALIVATGAKWRELNVPGEKEYLGRGVAFCPHCDGPFYAGKRVAVVGGGNSGVEAAIDLSNITSHVTLIEFADTLKADAVLVEKLKSRKNVNVITSAKTTAVLGDGQKVNALAYEDRGTGEPKQLSLDGVFVQIGLIPNSSFLKGVVELNRYGEILVDAKGHTNVPGIYAAGDVTTVPFKQIVISMGEGAKVALAAFEDQTLRR